MMSHIWEACEGTRFLNSIRPLSSVFHILRSRGLITARYYHVTVGALGSLSSLTGTKSLCPRAGVIPSRLAGSKSASLRRRHTTMMILVRLRPEPKGRPRAGHCATPSRTRASAGFAAGVPAVQLRLSRLPVKYNQDVNHHDITFVDTDARAGVSAIGA